MEKAQQISEMIKWKKSGDPVPNGTDPCMEKLIKIFILKN